MTESTWNEYSKLVLKELETLGLGIQNLNTEMQEIKKEIALIKDRENRVDKLQDWKEKISEITSPSQLGETIADVKNLKEFKTRAVTGFLIIQGLMSAIMVILNYLKH